MTSKWTKALSDAVGRVDGWVNVLTGIGMAGRDKRLGASATVDLLCRQDLEAIWRGNDMGAKIINTIPNEMLREGFCVKVQVEDDGDADDAKQASELLMARCEELDVEAKFKTAMQYERAYGGGALLIGADDGNKDLRRPLNEESIKTLNWITTLEREELYPTVWYTNPQAPKYGEPMIYQIRPNGFATGSAYIEVHESRLIRFGGIVVSRQQLQAQNGWGDSVLIRCNEVLRDFNMTWGAASLLCQDFAQAVLKIEGLAELISTNNDDVVIRRAQLLDMQRSTARMIMLDATEEFERKATPMTGLPEMLDKFALRLASAADMPVSLLLGQAPAGLNATGASDVRFFYDRTKAAQRTELRPRLARFLKLLMRAKNGPTLGNEPKNWSIYFMPLWQLTELEQAQVRKTQAETDQIYLMNQVASPEEIGASRFGGDEYSTDTVLDFDARASVRALKPEPELKVPDAL